MRCVVAHGVKSRPAPYLDAIRDAGADPVSVTPERPLESFDGFAGLLLTGGTDLDSCLYGQQRIKQTGAPDRERDQLELRLLREALARDLPVLAICRGMQLFNVAHGGTLHQHIDGHADRRLDRSEPVHSVTVAAGSTLEQIVCASQLHVNSRHHQAVDRVGAGLVVSARSLPDDVVEGLEHPAKRFAVAVQWHPEDQFLNSPQHRELFHAFCGAGFSLQRRL